MLETDWTVIPREQKIAIAREAKRDGAWVVSKRYGISKNLVAAWIGTYCREVKA